MTSRDLYDRICNRLQNIEAQIRLYTIIAQTLGNDINKIDAVCFDYITASDTLAFYDYQTIPRILKKDVPVEYLGNKNPLHYNITPYSYMPKIGKKIITNPYIDIGQGLIELIKEVAKKENLHEDNMSLAYIK